MISTLVVGLLLTSSPPATADDPVVIQVNLTEIRRSELSAELKGDAKGDLKVAVQSLVIRALLLQEAANLAKKVALPTEPKARARVFLDKVMSKRVICGNLTDRELEQMYTVMKPRFVHGHLYRIAELSWRCGGGLEPERASCRQSARQYADTHWRTIAETLKTAQDLHLLGERGTAPADTLTYVEMMIHVDNKGGANVPKDVAHHVRKLKPGTASVVHNHRGAFVRLLLEYRPPQTRDLKDPDVAKQVRAEVCKRQVAANKQRYIDDLIKSASVRLFKNRFPGQDKNK